MRVDIGIALLPKGLPDFVDAGRAPRQLESAFDDVLGLHGGSGCFVTVMNGRHALLFPAPYFGGRPLLYRHC